MGIAFRITMNTGQRFSAKVATAFFFLNQYSYKRTRCFAKTLKKVNGRFFYLLLLGAFSSCGGKMSGPKQMFIKAA